MTRLLCLLATLSLADLPAADFPLVRDHRAATLVVSPNDHEVVRVAAADLASDIERITGIKPSLADSPLSAADAPRVLIGTLGRSPAIDSLVSSGQLDVSHVVGQWETFLIATVGRDLVIAGSDRRGTAYGVYELSQHIGVSPWHWWADVHPERKSELIIPEGAQQFGPPSVRYRGIFINDEDWGLQPWAAQTFEPETGDIGPKTYQKVFELLLRLKANTLWPAMHECTAPFNADPRHAALADRHAIVMGSSHAEPMLRNNVREWTAPKPDYNYLTNRDGVRAYWEERVRTNGRFENIYTLGMRGIHDSGIQGARTDAERIAVLEQVFADQRALLAQHVSPHVERLPQMFCAYKEVLDLYRQGLRVPDDVTIVWPDDNFGYVRNFAAAAERQRSGGFGVYYHISYLGRPLAYLWLNTTPPGLIWHEMTKAYAHGADRIWIVNVGDIKPAEIGTEFFLRLAWDVHQWGPDAQEKFLREWAAREFGEAHATEIAGLMGDYYLLNFQRKPEHLQWWLPREPPVPSPLTRKEIELRLSAFAELSRQLERITPLIIPARRDAWYQLVEYPVRGSHSANLRYFTAEIAPNTSARGEVLGTELTFSELAQTSDATLRQLTDRFGQIAGGKWRGFMRLEPADDQWKSMRLAPWSLEKQPRATAADPTSPVISVPAARFAAKEGNIPSVTGLGRTGAAIPLYPDARLTYAIDVPESGEWTLFVHLLPTHALSGDRLRLGVALGNESPRTLELPVADGSAAWAQGVLDGARIITTKIGFPASGRHEIVIHGIDAGVVLDRLVLTRGEKHPGYLGLPAQ